MSVYAYQCGEFSEDDQPPDSPKDDSKPWYQRATLPRKIGVVVPTRHRAHFLPHMLGSLMAQSLAPERILVVDDGGCDDTLEVVERYPRVEYLRVNVGNGKSGNPARNVGLKELADLPYLCFVDDDDMIPPNYLQCLLETLEKDCRLAAAYPRMIFCGQSNRLWKHAWDKDRLGRTNLSGTPALIRTDALLQVGGWPIFEPDELGTMPYDDWALWRRLRDHGWRMKLAPVDYFYYRHDNGVCQSNARANHRSQWRRTIDPLNLITIAIPFSGRAHLLDDLLDAVAAQTYPSEHIHLLFYDNSGDEAFQHRLQTWLLEHPDYAGSLYFKDLRTAVAGRTARAVADAPLVEGELGRRRFGRELNHHVGALWNRIGQLAHTDLVWCLEDDVVPPPDALERLLDRMNPTVDAVTAAYESRVVPNCCVAWTYESLQSGRVRHLRRGAGVEAIGGCGFGCVLARRELFSAGPARSAGEAVGFDCNFWLDLARRGGKVLMDWDVFCEHRIEFCTAGASPQ